MAAGTFTAHRGQPLTSLGFAAAVAAAGTVWITTAVADRQWLFVSWLVPGLLALAALGIARLARRREGRTALSSYGDLLAGATLLAWAMLSGLALYHQGLFG